MTSKRAVVNTPSPRDLHLLTQLCEPLLGIDPTRTPRFGTKAGLDFPEFNARYGADALYGPLGLASQAMYQAHRHAAAMTAVYRQLGTGTERLFRQLLADLGLDADQRRWSYAVPDTKRRRYLDGRVAFTDLAKPAAKDRFVAFAAKHWDLETPCAGMVFELRSGYKSADAKRSNGDKDAVAQARSQGLLPVMLIMSDQVDEAIIAAYINAGWTVLRGDETMTFLKTMFKVNLPALLKRNRAWLDAVVASHVVKVLSA